MTAPGLPLTCRPAGNARSTRRPTLMKHTSSAVATTLVISHLLVGCIFPGAEAEDEGGPGTESSPPTSTDSTSGSTSTSTDADSTSTTTSDSSTSEPTTSESTSDDSSTGECGSSPDVVWVQDFEEGPGDWSVEGGVWRFGSPTEPSGPGDAHGGANVASTGLDDDYPSASQARLVSPEFTVPDAAESPHLRIWQFYAFDIGDFGQLQIRVDNGPWQPLPVTGGLLTLSGASWIQQIVPLEAFAQDSVQIAFYFASEGSRTNSSGWSVDDVSLEVGPMTLDSPEGFECGFGDWSVEGGVWELGQPTAEFGPDAYGGENVMGTVLAGDYQSAARARLVSPAFTVPDAAENPRMRLQQWFDFGAGDLGQFEVRVVGGSWQLVQGSPMQGESGSWIQTDIPLGAFEQETIQVSFPFASEGSPTNALGWYIDDVSLETD